MFWDIFSDKKTSIQVLLKQKSSLIIYQGVSVSTKLMSSLQKFLWVLCITVKENVEIFLVLKKHHVSEVLLRRKLFFGMTNQLILLPWCDSAGAASRNSRQLCVVIDDIFRFLSHLRMRWDLIFDPLFNTYLFFKKWLIPMIFAIVLPLWCV